MRGNRRELGKVFYMKNHLHFKANSNQLAAQGSDLKFQNTEISLWYFTLKFQPF